jgi:hypothetical protein
MSKRKLMAIKIFGIGGRLFKSIGRSRGGAGSFYSDGRRRS